MLPLIAKMSNISSNSFILSYSKIDSIVVDKVLNPTHPTQKAKDPAQ